MTDVRTQEHRAATVALPQTGWASPTARTLLDLSVPGGDPALCAHWQMGDSIVLLSRDGVLNVLNPWAAAAWTLHRRGLRDDEVASTLSARSGVTFAHAHTGCQRLLARLHQMGCCPDRDAVDRVV